MTNTSKDDLSNPATQFGAGKIAAGVMLGIACYQVVASLVKHLLLPPIGYLTREMEFAELAIEIPVRGDDPVEIKYGMFLTALVTLIVLLILIWLARKVTRRRGRAS